MNFARPGGTQNVYGIMINLTTELDIPGQPERKARPKRVRVRGDHQRQGDTSHQIIDLTENTTRRINTKTHQASGMMITVAGLGLVVTACTARPLRAAGVLDAVRTAVQRRE